jgi:ABC-type phosphate transport system substrate-binding protein
MMPARSTRSLLICLLLLGSCIVSVWLPGAALADSAAAYQIICHPSNAQTSATRRFLSDAFLKKTTRWQSGEVIHPVDQVADSAVRRKFTEEILDRSVAAVRSYWQQVIFSGRDVPPPELANDSEVVSYVLEHDGAVGYISRSANPGGTKVLTVQ